MPTPHLIVVTGRPGSGKTTLAHALARQVRCPAICRDEIKEGLINTTGDMDTMTADSEVGRNVYETFFDTVKLLIDRRVTLIAEAAFQHKLWAPKLEPLREIARVRIIVCSIDATLARQRHDQRGVADPGRLQFHHPWPGGEYDPPRLDVPTLSVDTSDGYSPTMDAIVAFARE
jgi:predicted kinase